jgi:hypothetical protein
MPADRRHAARLQGVLLNAARVAAVSDAAAIQESVAVAVDEAVTGDLVASSPALSSKINEINGRLQALEAAIP